MILLLAPHGGPRALASALPPSPSGVGAAAPPSGRLRLPLALFLPRCSTRRKFGRSAAPPHGAHRGGCRRRAARRARRFRGPSVAPLPLAMAPHCRLDRKVEATPLFRRPRRSPPRGAVALLPPSRPPAARAARRGGAAAAPRRCRRLPAVASKAAAAPCPLHQRGWAPKERGSLAQKLGYDE